MVHFKIFKKQLNIKVLKPKTPVYDTETLTSLRQYKFQGICYKTLKKFEILYFVELNLSTVINKKTNMIENKKQHKLF